MKPGHYLKLTLLLTLTLLAAAAALVCYNQPYSGDMTRVSTQIEREFGWNSNQSVITPLADTPHANVLVIGDSFSAGRSWQALAHRVTGLSFSFVHIDQAPVERMPQLMATHQPDFVIFERVERMLLHSFPDPVPGCQPHPQPPNAKTKIPEAGPSPASLLTGLSTHKRQTLPDSPRMLAQALHYLKMHRRAKPQPNVVPARLTRSDLFTNSRTGEVLILTEDHQFDQEVPAASQSDVICSLTTWLATTHRPTLLVLIPDKTTAYQEYLPSLVALRKRPSLIEGIYSLPGADVFNATTALRAHIQAGHRDVYQPNDTHFGPEGFAVLASHIIPWLQEQQRRHPVASPSLPASP